VEVAHGFSMKMSTRTSTSSTISWEALRNRRVLVVGGSGRVGGSVVTQLTQHGAKAVVGGRSNVDNKDFDVIRARWQTQFPQCANALSAVPYVTLDRHTTASVLPLLQNDTEYFFDLVIHTAGPFQNKVSAVNGVLEACCQAGVPYIDVCDDYCTAKAAQTKYTSLAKSNAVPCIVSTGCWPGVSSLMAAQLVHYVSLQQKDHQEKEQPSTTSPMSTDQGNLTVDFSFFTAGSGGAGVTLLVATFLILAEQALTVVNGRRKPVPPMKDYKSVDFGSKIGHKDVAPLNLLETVSIADNIPYITNVSSRFGTAPGFWNTLLSWMAKLPKSLLANEELMYKLSTFSLPLVRLVDLFAGATNAMRCDVYAGNDNDKTGIHATAVYGHANLEPCVGECVTALAAAVLSDNVVSPGVWFPEQAIQNPSDVASVLHLASVNAHTTTVESNFGLTQEQIWGESDTGQPQETTAALPT
jgi:saccharopine dehydrogenase-like NADP-dependent oxidoreductase